MTMNIVCDDKKRGIYAHTAVGRLEDDIIKTIAGNPALFGTIYFSSNACSLVKQDGKKNAYTEVQQVETDPELYNVIIYSAGNDLEFLEKSLDFLVSTIQLEDPFRIGGRTITLLTLNTKRFLEKYFEVYVKK
jgi:hypothetical protein